MPEGARVVALADDGKHTDGGMNVHWQTERQARQRTHSSVQAYWRMRCILWQVELVAAAQLGAARHVPQSIWPHCKATQALGVTLLSFQPAGYFKATKPKREKGKSKPDEAATCVSAAYAKAVEHDLSSRPAYQQVTNPGPLKGHHSSAHCQAAACAEARRTWQLLACQMACRARCVELAPAMMSRARTKRWA